CTRASIEAAGTFDYW
nr:immunoglobulin heavy chain junction region [Macaca mulatta]